MKYELMLLIKPLTNEDVKDRVFIKVEKLAKDLKGEVEIKDQIGKRLLAYEIAGFKEGYYLVTSLTLDPTKLDDFKHELGLVNEVLRFLVIDEANL